MKNYFKLFAAGCSLIHVLLYLFLPLVAVKLVGIGLSALDVIDSSIWCYLPLVFGVAMLVCSLLLPGKLGGIVCAVGAFMPLIVFFIVRTTVISDALSLFGTAISSLGTTGINQLLTIGAGPILALIAGLVAAVLCFVADSNLTKPVHHEAGLGSSVDDEW